MTLESIRLLTKFTRNEVTQLFDNIKIRSRKQGLEILLAPKSLSYGRILIIASRKTGPAPIRNKFRRRLKAIFYENKLFEQNFDWIVIAKSKSATKIDFSKLQEILLNATKS